MNLRPYPGRFNIDQPAHQTTASIPGYHSKTPCDYAAENSDDVLRSSSYHQSCIDLSVIWYPPWEHAPFVTSTLPDSREPKATIGELDRLPLELINEICLQLDIASVFCFRQVNARARQILGALHEFRIISTHAINPLCTLLRTGAAPCVTLLEFYDLLCTKRCSLCTFGYGNLVYLPTWTRCCSYCLRSFVSETLVTTVAKAKRVLKLSKKSLEKLSKIKTLPGAYTMDERRREKRIAIVSTLSAMSAYRDQNDGMEPARQMLRSLAVPHIFSFMACCTLPSYDWQSGQVEKGLSCVGCEVAVQDEINTHAGKYAFDMRDMVYSREGFLEHFRWCEQAQHLYLESNREEAHDLKWPVGCKRGGHLRPID